MVNLNTRYTYKQDWMDAIRVANQIAYCTVSFDYSSGHGDLTSNDIPAKYMTCLSLSWSDKDTNIIAMYNGSPPNTWVGFLSKTGTAVEWKRVTLT